MKLFIFHIMICLFLTLFTLSSVAASGEGIPVSFVLFQAFNFLIFFGILAYIFLKKAPPFVLRQYKDYVSMKKRAEDLYQQAKKNKEETQKKLFRIKERQTRFDEELRLELEKMEVQLNQDLKEQQSSIARMAKNFIDQELIKLKTNLKNKFLNQVEALCRESLKNSVQKNSFFTQKLKG